MSENDTGTSTLRRAWDLATEALRDLRDAADAYGPCAEQSKARDALEALGLNREP